MTDGVLERILEGGNCALIEVLSQNSLERTDENYKKHARKAGGPALIQM